MVAQPYLDGGLCLKQNGVAFLSKNDMPAE